MRIEDLERAVMELVSMSPGQPAFAAIAGAGNAGMELPGEFSQAVRTLDARPHSGDSKLIETINALWL